MKARYGLGAVLCAVLLNSLPLAWAQAGTPSPAQPGAPTQQPWAYSLTVDGYIIPQQQGYASPVFTADHNWLHLEARYNYENYQTGSLWLGYNFNVGKKVQFTATPMIGGVIGQTTGIAPGLELSLTWKIISFSSSSEYVVDTTNIAGSFFYSWPELTFQVLKWLRLGGAAQHTKVYHTSLSTQRGPLIGLNYKALEFTTYILDPDLPHPTTVLEVGVSF